MGFRCGCPPTQKSQAHDENTHTHAHKLKGCCHRPCQYFLCVSVSLPIPVFTSLHLSMSHSVSTSASLRVSLSLWLHVCRLTPSLFLHLSVSRSVPQSLLVFLFLSLSPCVSLSPFSLPLEDLAALMRVSARRTGPVTSHVPDRWRPAASTRVTGNRLDRKAACSPGEMISDKSELNSPSTDTAAFPLFLCRFFFS